MPLNFVIIRQRSIISYILWLIILVTPWKGLVQDLFALKISLYDFSFDIKVTAFSVSVAYFNIILG